MKKKFDIILVGGGSGGHLTPLIPIAEAVHSKDPNARIAHIGQKHDPMNSIVKESQDITGFYEVQAGKYRRYYGETWYKRIFDIKRLFFNFRDVFRVVVGIFQSWILLGKIKPKVLLTKGGYIGVPVGLAASLRGIPYITHDSDAIISLANKIISKKATYHATALNPDNYIGYEKSKTVQVGVPVRSSFMKVTTKEKQEAKKHLGYKQDEKLLLILGGGLGAKKINEAFIEGADQLLSELPELKVFHITGSKLLSESNTLYARQVTKHNLANITTVSFSNELNNLSAAADVVVTRAGATTMAELSAQGKACIIVPNPFLTGGHQSKNAEILERTGAAVVVRESELKNKFIIQIKQLLLSEDRQKKLSVSLHGQFIPGASKKLVDLLLKAAKD